MSWIHSHKFYILLRVYRAWLSAVENWEFLLYVFVTFWTDVQLIITLATKSFSLVLAEPFCLITSTKLTKNILFICFFVLWFLYCEKDIIFEKQLTFRFYFVTMWVNVNLFNPFTDIKSINPRWKLLNSLKLSHSTTM